MRGAGDNVDWKALAIELVERNGSILSIPNGATKVGKEAFRFATYSELIFPDSVVSIDTNSCASSSTLKRVTIGNGCTTLNDSCFLGDKNLEYVSLGESVSFIHSKAFQSCNALKTFICRAATPPTLTSLPANIIAIYVPDTSVEAYKAASGWSTYANKIYPISEYTE